MRTAVLFISLVTGALCACATSGDPPYDGLEPYPTSGAAAGGGNNPGAGSGTGGGTGQGTGTGDGTGGGAGGGTSGGNATDGGAGKDAGSGSANVSFGACVEATSPNGSGHHNEGKDCLLCHNANNTKGAPHWWVAGTLYDSATGTTPIAGATIEIIDAAGVKQQLVTAGNGNFWTDTQVKFPLKVRASSCPDDAVMMQSDSSGACGKTGCHDSAQRIHLP